MQGQDKAAENCKCDFSSLLNLKGWTIPGVDGAVADSERAKYEVPGVDGTAYVTMMKPGSKPATVTQVLCSKLRSGVTEIRWLDIRVMKLWRFDIEGKVFAYGVSGAWLASKDQTGDLVELGSASNVLFYDLDGSGKFVLMRTAGFPFVPEVPRWLSAAPAKDHGR